MIHSRQNHAPYKSDNVHVGDSEGRFHKIKVEELSSGPNAEVHHENWNERFLAMTHTAFPCFAFHKCQTCNEASVERDRI